jgi:hypothetical protein
MGNLVWNGEYPVINITSMKQLLDSLSSLTTTAKIDAMDGKDISEKFALITSMIEDITREVNNTQGAHEYVIKDLVDSMMLLGNDLHSKINAVSGLAEDELDAFKAKIEVLRNINVDTISDLINGQRQVIELLNGMTDTIELPQMGINTVANGTLVIDISSLGFAAGDVYSISAIADNTLVNVSLDRPNSDHTKATLFLRDTRYDFVKGFDTTAQAVSLDLTLTHKNRAKITNSVTRVDNIDDTDTANDTKEEVVVGE